MGEPETLWLARDQDGESIELARVDGKLIIRTTFRGADGRRVTRFLECTREELWSLGEALAKAWVESSSEGG
jgi:hypothetical protein